MNRNYVDKRQEGYWVAGTRVSLDSVIWAFLDGQTAESIAPSFPVLTLEQVYGAIAFYLANRRELEPYLQKAARAVEAQCNASREADPMFYQKLADAWRQGRMIPS